MQPQEQSTVTGSLSTLLYISPRTHWLSLPTAQATGRIVRLLTRARHTGDTHLSHAGPPGDALSLPVGRRAPQGLCHQGPDAPTSAIEVALLL